MRTLFPLPTEYTKRIIHKSGSDFRTATRLQTVPMPRALSKGKVLVRNIAVGINASDVHYAAGVYRPGVSSQFDCGFEALSVVVAIVDMPIAPNALKVRIGSVVLVSSYSAFSEYQVVPSYSCFPVSGSEVPSEDSCEDFNRSISTIYRRHRHFLPLTLSGATAVLSLGVAFRTLQASGTTPFPPLDHHQGLADNFFGMYRTSHRINALITASAGGVGHLLTQLVSHYMPNSTILAVTSSREKGEWIEKCCFRGEKSESNRAPSKVLCYNENCLDCLLRQHTSRSPNRSLPPATGGLNLIFDSVGGETLRSVMRYASNKSVTMAIGSTSNYANAKWSEAIRGRTSENESASVKSSPIPTSGVKHIFENCPVSLEKNTQDNSPSDSLSISSQLLTKSASMTGFFLPHYTKYVPHAVDHLIQLTERKVIAPQIDTQQDFVGLKSIPSAVEYLYSKKSRGKVVVRIV